MQMGRLLKGASVLMSVAAVGSALAGFYFHNVAVARSREQFLVDNPDLKDVGESMLTLVKS